LWSNRIPEQLPKSAIVWIFPAPIVNLNPLILCGNPLLQTAASVPVIVMFVEPAPAPISLMPFPAGSESPLHVQFPAGTKTVSPLPALAIAELTCDAEQLTALMVAASTLGRRNESAMMEREAASVALDPSIWPIRSDDRPGNLRAACLLVAE
jgi:hypothetical protein